MNYAPTLSVSQLLAWSRETIREPQAPDTMVMLACQRLIRFSSDPTERARAGDLLALLESEAGPELRAVCADRFARSPIETKRPT